MNKKLLTATLVLVALLIGAVLIVWTKGKTNEQYTSPGGLPVFYINLDRDTKNKNLIEQSLKPMFPNLKRSPGILHSVGREGCRLAHIRANQTGVKATKPGEYYIILEDDANLNGKAKVTQQQALDAIKQSAETKADMILLNIQNFPYDVKMVGAPKNIKPPGKFYRLLGGVGSGLAYMVKHEFGKKLIEHWKKRPMDHIDLTWHELWPSNLVLVHKPLLFLSRAGPSTTGDVLWRNSSDPEIDDFQWNLVPNMKNM